MNPYREFLLLLSLLFLLPITGQERQPTPLSPDSSLAAATSDSLEISSPASRDTVWWRRILDGKFAMQDTSIQAPKFVKFCMNVYNWGDKAFNSYDTTYVVGTGHRWKFRIVSDNWVDSYAMSFKGLNGKMPIWMLSDIYANVGAYLQYMAVSAGYSVDIANLIGTEPVYHKKFEFGFNCARFNAEVYYQENTGGSYLRKFGKYKHGHTFKQKFPGLSLRTSGIDAYYFFNNRKYSQGASYNFSKIQKKSAGSFLAGFSYCNLDLSLDFNELPDYLEPYYTPEAREYHFHYDSYALIFGYGYNWVITRDLLFNISAMPSVGLAHCHEDSQEGRGNMLSLNIAGRTSLTYNMGNIFFSLIGKMNGHWYKSRSISLFSSIENFSANIGIRF